MARIYPSRAQNHPNTPNDCLVAVRMKKSKSFYDFPRYYDIAFSFRDIAREARLFDECFIRYSKVRVRRVLELGSGTSPHLEEWRKRGIEYVGIDTNRIMLSHSRNKALAFGWSLVSSMRI